MTYEAWDISAAAYACYRAAERHGWKAHSPSPDCATFVKGERYMLIFIAINGGITLVRTDQGDYRGKDRKLYAANYLRTAT